MYIKFTCADSFLGKMLTRSNINLVYIIARVQNANSARSTCNWDAVDSRGKVEITFEHYD